MDGVDRELGYLMSAYQLLKASYRFLEEEPLQTWEFCGSAEFFSFKEGSLTCRQHRMPHSRPLIYFLFDGRCPKENNGLRPGSNLPLQMQRPVTLTTALPRVASGPVALVKR